MGIFRYMKELDGVGAFNVTCYSMGKASKFIVGREDPSIFKSLVAYQVLAGFHVNDGVDTVTMASQEVCSDAGIVRHN